MTKQEVKERVREAIQRVPHLADIKSVAVFGSYISGTPTEDSDVDVLVSFHEQAGWRLWDLVEMQEELEKMFGRKVDLVEKEALRNPYRRHSILNGREIFYVAN